MNKMSNKSQWWHCPHFKDCPGCQSFAPPQAVDDVRCFFEPWKLQIRYIQGAETCWRSRAKLAVRASHAEYVIGLFEEGSHKVIDMKECAMHTPAINRALEVVRKALSSTKFLSFYRESSHTGALRYILFSEETLSSKVSVVFVLNLSSDSPEVDRWKSFCLSLWHRHPTLFHGCWLNFHTLVSNTIASSNNLHVAGAVWQWERVGDVLLPFHPLHFRQINLPLFVQLLSDVERYIPANTSILDLFGGMGAIGFFLSQKASRIDCVEIEASAQVSFEEARKRLPWPISQLVFFHHVSCNAKEIDALLKQAQTIIVDPPRKGLSPSLIAALEHSSASTLVYISCCAKTLLLNMDQFLQGVWEPIFVRTYQFFPGTEHLECAVVLKRKSG